MEQSTEPPASDLMPKPESPRISEAAADVTESVFNSNVALLKEVEEPWLADLNPTSFPLLHISKRISSSTYGTTHEAFLILSKEDSGSYKAMRCIAKRPWSMTELKDGVPSKVLAFEQDAIAGDTQPPESWELDAKAATIRQYYEVEIHVSNKFGEKKALYQRMRQQKQLEEEKGFGKVDNSLPNDDIVSAVQMLKGVYPDDGSGGPNAEDAIPEYGLADLDVWGKALANGCHEWLVFESTSELSLMDQFTTPNGNEAHRLYGIQKAMNLSEALTFGDTLDAVFLSLLEDLVFLSSCNVVHRDCK